MLDSLFPNDSGHESIEANWKTFKEKILVTQVEIFSSTHEFYVKEHEKKWGSISKLSIYGIISGWTPDNIYNNGNISHISNFIFNYNDLLSNTFKSGEIQRKFNSF